VGDITGIEQQAVDRVPRPRLKAREVYDRLSGWYDLLAASEARFGAQGLNLLAAQAGERVLETGCGTGKNALALAEQVGPSGQVVGVDLSGGMLAQARLRLNSSEAGSSAALLQADAVFLPCPPNWFDAAFAAFTLELFDTPEIVLVLGELRRVLRPGGRLCVVSLAAQVRPSPAARLYGWFHRRFPAWVDCRPIPAEQFLAQAGFQVRERQDGSLWGLPVGIVIGLQTAQQE
jgi:ubiquinone/menaquinone biosynthesis C-methylase UbiE